MTEKNAFNPREWTFLVTFPYRIGLWMAHLDEGGGTYAKEAEMKALSDIILTIEQKYKNIPFLFSLTQGTVDFAKNTACTDLAAEDMKSLLSDTKKLFDLLKNNATHQEINVYKILLIDVAEAVAKAAADREFGVHNLYGGLDKGIFGLLAKPMRLGRGPKVSRKEKEAINALIDALDANEIIQKWELDPFGTK